MFDFSSMKGLTAKGTPAQGTAAPDLAATPRTSVTHSEMDQFFEQWASEDTFHFTNRAVTEAKAGAGNRGTMRFGF